jgi:gliding motility-associated-like protein
MKTRLLYYFSITVYLLVFAFTNLHSQNRPAGSWSKKLERQKSFIENKGQFTIPNSFGNPSEVLFAVDDGGTKIYFTKKGITYTFLEMWKKPKDEKELERERNEVILDAEAHERHEKEERKIKTKTDQVTMLWQNANPNVKIEASGVTDDYHSYYFKQANTQYKNVCYIRGFRNITYKDIYPNIDIDYVFHEKGGLEYSLTLHPGADPSQVKMVYDSHVDLNNAGEIRISTKFGDIIDHAPLTFYQNNNASVIASSFTRTGKTVSFQLANYDNTKTVVIDPWTQTPAFATNWDCVWECEKDGAGNVYLIGGVSPMQLIKYNAAGAIQWTYNTPYDTTAWLGTFATDNAGNSYVTQGSVAQIVRVSTAGAVVWNNTSPGGIFGSTEFWNITFNCDQTKLVIGGTGGFLPPLPYIYEMNMANGNVISSLQVTPGALIPTQEVRSIAPCGNGRYYFLTHDTIGYINQNFNACSNPNAAIYKATNTYSFGYKCENFRYDNTAIMAIKANTSFVYVNRGNRLDKRNLNTSAIISSVVIPGGGFAGGFGGNAVQNSGIDIDDCGNVYVGSKNAVIKFDANLNQLASYPTTYNVYDVHVTTGGNIIACGSTGTSATGSRSGTLEHINAGACATITLTCCDVNICQVPNQCSTNAPFNLQAATAGGTWSGPGITNATTGTFNPSTAGIGTHVVTYSLACGVGSTTINVTACGSVSLCINSGSLSVIGGASTYTWSSTTTSVSCAACPGGNCIPFICAGTTVPTWTASGTTVAAPSATVFPIKVKDLGSGITFTFTTLAGIPPCTTTACPTLTMAVASQTNVNCFGASTGTANVSTSGGTGPYTYTWSPGSLTGASQTGLAAGTYTIAIKDANSCAGTGTVIITQPTSSLTAAITATTATSCSASTGGATVTVNGGTPGYTYSWAPSGGTTAGVSNLATGNNTVIITDIKGCNFTAIATIPCSNFCQPNGNLAIFSNYDGGILTINVDQNIPNLKVGICTYEPIQVNFTGPFVGNVTQVIYAGFNSNQNNNNCGLGNFPTSITGVPAGIVTINPPLSPPLVGYTPVHNNGAGPWGGLMIGTAGNCDTTINGGGTNTPDEIVYYFQQATAGTLLFHQTQYNCWINQTLNISTGGNCCILPSNTSCPTLTLSVTSQTNVNCFGANTGTATVSTSGGVAPYTYTWSPGNLNGASQTALSAGVYSINTTDASSCIGSGTISITQPTSSLTAVISATTPASCGGSTTTAIFWTENFGVGCNQGALASVYTGTNGAWAVTNTGVNNPSASQWFVSATESGMGAGNCGDGCLGAGTTNRTLHVANVSTSPAAFLFCPTGDCGAAYDTGIGANNVAADKRAESPTINCTGQSNITLNFNYIEGGQTTIDDATLWYFDGATWTQIDNMPKTIVCGSGQGQWGTRTIVLPASANNNANVKVGYRWVNNDDGAGSDPSFAVDDITLSASSGAGGTGGATVTASGGTAGYTYAWTPSGGTTAGVSNLGAGSNTVVVTDSKGCTATAIANITSTGGPTLTTVSQASVTCFGASTGTATVAGSGGTSPFTYTWSPGNLSGASQTSLAAGTYTINLMDANSCAGSGTLVIAQPTSSLSAVISATTGAGCGASTGGATVTASGGTPSYTYAWVPSGGTTAGVSNLGAGNNTVVVIDANSCTVSAVANITTAGGPTLSVTSQTNVNCFGASTGSATINATGGTAPITYTWSPGNLSGTSQTGLAAGTYTINALDGNSCASSTTVLITQPTASLTGVISNSTAPGCGSSTGGASVTASGGTPTYSYSWSPNGGTTPSVSNLSSGNSTVTITDSKGCTQSVVVSLASVSGPTLSVVSQTSVSCLGASTGAATVTAAGGTGPYTYTWSPGNLIGASQSSLAAGVYTVTVRDVNLCSGTGTISITQPTAGITGTITTTPTGCGNSIGSATVTASGGVPAYTYTWGPAPGSGTSISGLGVGSYSVIVADAQGCSVILNTSISTSGAGPALSISSQTNAVCASSTNAGASISATGTGPFTYSWTPVGGNSATSSGLSGGTYTVFVADAALCVSTITINITQPPAIVVTVTNTTASCGNYDGSATVTMSGGTGSLTPLWSVNSNSATVTGLSAGTYSVLVTDATGCTASAITNVNSVGSLTVNTSSDVTINDGESTQIIAFVPNGASVVWTPSTGLSCATCSATIASPTVTTEYCAYTTIGSCADTSCVLITVEVDCESKTDYSTPTAFSPNNDGINDEFCLKGWNECVTTFYIGIYNRWGEKIYESEDPGFCWDGTFKGNPLNSAVFVYYIKATVKDIGEVVRKGNITLVK